MSKKERLTVFIGGGGGGSGRRASSNEREVDLSQKKKSARHFQAAPSRLSSPTPRICKEKGVPSRFSARVEAHDGWTRGKRGRNGADVLQRKKKNRRRRAFFFFLSSKQQPKRASTIIALSFPLAHHCLFFSSSRIPKTSGSASTRGVSASGKTPSILATVFSFLFFEGRRRREGLVFFRL